MPSLDELPDDIQERILEVQEKSGFVPNVFLTLAHRPDEFRAFFAYHDALMLKPSGLTKGEREMIVVATSGANNCVYCVVAHGAILRIYEKNPLIAEQVATNYRKADIPPRQKAMLAFAMKIATASGTIEDADFEALQPAWLQRRGHLGHRRDRRVLRAVQSHGEHDRHAAERRVLPAGPAAAREEGLSTGETEPARALGLTPPILIVDVQLVERRDHVEADYVALRAEPRVRPRLRCNNIATNSTGARSPAADSIGAEVLAR